MLNPRQGQRVQMKMLLAGTGCSAPGLGVPHSRVNGGCKMNVLFPIPFVLARASVARCSGNGEAREARSADRGV